MTGAGEVAFGPAVVLEVAEEALLPDRHSRVAVEDPGGLADGVGEEVLETDGRVDDLVAEDERQLLAEPAQQLDGLMGGLVLEDGDRFRERVHRDQWLAGLLRPGGPRVQGGVRVVRRVFVLGKCVEVGRGGEHFELVDKDAEVAMVRPAQGDQDARGMIR